MKHLKMLGLATVASMALMAVVGAGTAAAVNKICSTSGTGTSCGAGHGNEFTGTVHATLESGTVVELTSDLDDVSCTESTIHGSITASTPPTGFIDAMTLSGTCMDSFGGTCTALTNASASNHWPGGAVATGGTNGTMTVENLTVSFTCPIFGSLVTCVYQAARATTSITGSDSTATVKASSVGLKKEGGGFACSENAAWDGSYLITTPDSLNITE